MEDTELIKGENGKTTRSKSSHSSHSSVPLWLTMAVYIVTAMLQPTLTDEIRYSGGAGHVGWPPTVLATLANTLAMASLLAIAPGGWPALKLTLTSRQTCGRVLACTVIDFFSGCLLTTGLLMVGGGMFVVVYASTTVWTAIWARCTGSHLSIGRWLGVLLVFTGMVLNSGQAFLQAARESSAASTKLVAGLCIVVLGTMLHAAMFVASELAIKAQIDLLLLCAGMGLIESAVLVAWNLLLLRLFGPALYKPDESELLLLREQATLATPLVLVGLYLLLTLINAVHAWSFFNMLQRVGAVSSAVMKGTQLVLVFGVSIVFFCRFQATQCFSWNKAGGVTVVCLGLLVYANSSAETKKKGETLS